MYVYIYILDMIYIYTHGYTYLHIYERNNRQIIEIDNSKDPENSPKKCSSLP